MHLEQLEQLLTRKDLRSADRAFLSIMRKKLRKGEVLSYQEQLNLYAFFSRYGVLTVRM